MAQPNFCPKCGNPLKETYLKERDRLVCGSETCNYVHWNNPIPVVAAVVEYGENVVLVQSIGWPPTWFGLVTGFLESGEMPEEGVRREVEEETGLAVEEVNYIGMYPFYRMNQLLIAYHVKASGVVSLDTSELAAYKIVPITKVRPWSSGTGLALRDWLKTKGIDRDVVRFGS